MSFTLLWVEDNPDDILLGERALQKAGFEKIRIARDGEEAIAYLSGTDAFADRARFPMPSLVLLDLKLPRKSGMEVLRWIRGTQGLRRIPVVILTSSQERSDVEHAYDLGANAYLVKPVGVGTFAEMTGVFTSSGPASTRPRKQPPQPFEPRADEKHRSWERALHRLRRSHSNPNIHFGMTRKRSS